MERMDGKPAIAPSEPVAYDPEHRLDRLEMRSISLAKENEALKDMISGLLDSQQHHLEHSRNMREAAAVTADAINNIVYALEDIVSRLRRLEGKEAQW